MDRKIQSGLAAFLAGALSVVQVNANPKVEVSFDRENYFPGDQGAMTIRLDASGTGFAVTALTISQDPYPSAIQQPLDGHSIYSSETDNSGTYLEGFLQGRPVESANQVTDVSAIIMRGVPPFEGVPEPNDKAITYNFTIRSNAQTGQHTASINEAWVTHRTVNPLTYHDVPVASQDLIPGTFNVILPKSGDFDNDGDIDMADAEHILNCTTGPGEFYENISSNGCLNADIDSDHDVDLRDNYLFGHDDMGVYK